MAVVNFQDKQFNWRLTHLQGRNEMIAKAIGYKKNEPLSVLDTTAGFGKESFLLAALGCQVRLLERHPQIADLLQQGLVQAALDPALAPIVARMQFEQRCSIELLSSATDYKPDVIYCDPMFNARHKTAAVKKDMQFIQSVVTDDQDGEQLVALALQRANKRVVVKRARLAPLLAANPSYQLKARSHRYDVYLIRHSCASVLSNENPHC